MDFCRVCTASVSEHIKVFSISENAEPLANMIYELSGLEVLKNDGLPDIVCETCVRDLKSALDLKRKCIRSDEKLRLMIRTESFQNPIYEETVETNVPVISFKILYDEGIENISPDSEENFIDNLECTLTKDPCEGENSKPIKITAFQLANLEDPVTRQHVEYEEIVEHTTLKIESTCTDGTECSLRLDSNKEKPPKRMQDTKNTNPLQNDQLKNIEIKNNTHNNIENREDGAAKLFLKQVEHPDVNKTDDKLLNNSCCGCEQVFQTKTELSLHSNEVHKPHRTLDDKKPFECAVCYKRYTSHRGFKTHKNNMLKFKTYQCSMCGKRFCNSRVLENHERIHTKQKPFPCTVCSKSFRSKSNLLSHAKLHSANTESTKHMCNICNKGFSRKSYLKYHNNLLHSEETPFACSFCPSKFKANANLRLHLRTHTQERPYSCDLCDKTFMYPTDKKRHVLQHLGQKPFKCKDCDKAFTRKTLLQKHRSNCHEADCL